MSRPQYNSSLRLLTTRQAAERLGVSLRTVQLWCNNGVLTYVRTVGGHRRITDASVAACMTLPAATKAAGGSFVYPKLSLDKLQHVARDARQTEGAQLHALRLDDGTDRQPIEVMTTPETNPSRVVMNLYLPIAASRTIEGGVLCLRLAYRLGTHVANGVHPINPSNLEIHVEDRSLPRDDSTD